VFPFLSATSFFTPVFLFAEALLSLSPISVRSHPRITCSFPSFFFYAVFSVPIHPLRVKCLLRFSLTFFSSGRLRPESFSLQNPFVFPTGSPLVRSLFLACGLHGGYYKLQVRSGGKSCFSVLLLPKLCAAKVLVFSVFFSVVSSLFRRQRGPPLD